MCPLNFCTMKSITPTPQKSRSYFLETLTFLAIGVIFVEIVFLSWSNDSSFLTSRVITQGISKDHPEWLLPSRSLEVIRASVNQTTLGGSSDAPAFSAPPSEAILMGEVLHLNGLQEAEIKSGVFLFLQLRADGSLKVDKATTTRATLASAP